MQAGSISKGDATVSNSVRGGSRATMRPGRRRGSYSKRRACRRGRAGSCLPIIGCTRNERAAEQKIVKAKSVGTTGFDSRIPAMDRSGWDRPTARAPPAKILAFPRRFFRRAVRYDLQRGPRLFPERTMPTPTVFDPEPLLA